MEFVLALLVIIGIPAFWFHSKCAENEERRQHERDRYMVEDTGA